MVTAGLLVGSARAYSQSIDTAPQRAKAVAATEEGSHEAEETGDTSEPASPTGGGSGSRARGIAWNPVIGLSLMFLTLQHSMRMTNDVMRSNLQGPFFRDWCDSVGHSTGSVTTGRF